MNKANDEKGKVTNTASESIFKDYLGLMRK